MGRFFSNKSNLFYFKISSILILLGILLGLDWAIEFQFADKQATLADWITAIGTMIIAVFTVALAIAAFISWKSNKKNEIAIEFQSSLFQNYSLALEYHLAHARHKAILESHYHLKRNLKELKAAGGCESRIALEETTIQMKRKRLQKEDEYLKKLETRLEHTSEKMQLDALALTAFDKNYYEVSLNLAQFRLYELQLSFDTYYEISNNTFHDIQRILCKKEILDLPKSLKIKI